MSTFDTAPPAWTAPPEDDVPALRVPGWLRAVQCVLACLVPLALLVAYWTKRIKAEEVVKWGVWSWLASCVLGLGWAVSSGELRRVVNA